MNAAHVTPGRVHGFKSLCLLAAITALPAVAPAAEKAPVINGMRDAATHDSIVEAAQTAREQAAREQTKEQQEQALKPVPPDQRPKPVERPTLLDMSDIICYRGLATLVPKQAVLHVPKELADHIGMQDGARFVQFQDFITKNRAWLTFTEVSRRQAEGNDPMSEAVVKSFAKETRIVVATFDGGPISVLPLKVPPPETAAAGSAAAGANHTATATANTSAAKK